MIRPISSPLLPVLPPVSPGAVSRPAATTPAAPGSAGRAAPGRLDFSGWHQPVPRPTVQGDRPYPGNPADASAVADAIAGLLLGRG
jgi:hypothetical protein